MVAPWMTKISHNMGEAVPAPAPEVERAPVPGIERREVVIEVIEPKEEEVALDLTKLLKSELTELAEEQGINHKGLTKAQLLEALQK